LSGIGRLVETTDLLGYISYTIGKNGDLAGKTVVVSAGGTVEPIDPVRVITNHSSGKMGYALAEAARDRGADVFLVTAPTSLLNPALVNVVQVQTAKQMGEAIKGHLDEADALIMAAAVADYRPATTADQKIKKTADDLNIPLAKTEDILKSAEGNYVRVGFAAESQNLVENAKAKVTSKNLDLIVANDITSEGSGFGSDTNQVTLIDRDLQVEELPLLTKYDVSNRILDRVRDLIRD
jgi:phosphopantothenoylcysteine decarboxylase/phosphopantothenate--cysteine ligase